MREYRARVSRYDPSLAELKDPGWSRVLGLSSAELVFSRALLASFAEGLHNEVFVASVWVDGAEPPVLAGVAVGISVLHPRDRRVLSVWVPQAGATLGQAVWVIEGHPVELVARHLLRALEAHATALSFHAMVVPFCQHGHGAMGEVATSLNMRPLEGNASYVLRLPADTTFDSYLASLRSKDRNSLVRDFRRADEAGARIHHELAPSDETIELIWRLQLETYRRHDSPLRPRGSNIIKALLDRLSRDRALVTTCWRGDALLGFMLSLQVGDLIDQPYTGHVEGAGFQVHLAVSAHAIRRDIERGGRHFVLGDTQDVYKQRLGGVAEPTVHWYLRLTAPAGPQN